jgi:hypothetical protein
MPTTQDDVSYLVQQEFSVYPGLYSATPARVPFDRCKPCLFRKTTVLLYAGPGGIAFTAVNRIDFVAEHSDDGVAWTAMNQAEVLGLAVDANAPGVVLSLQTATPGPTIQRFYYFGAKRFISVRPVFAGVHASPTAIAVVGGGAQPVMTSMAG